MIVLLTFVVIGEMFAISKLYRELDKTKRVVATTSLEIIRHMPDCELKRALLRKEGD